MKAEETDGARLQPEYPFSVPEIDLFEDFDGKLADARAYLRGSGGEDQTKSMAI